MKYIITVEKADGTKILDGVFDYYDDVLARFRLDFDKIEQAEEEEYDGEKTENTT
jgi:hypothetical protein